MSTEAIQTIEKLTKELIETKTKFWKIQRKCWFIAFGCMIFYLGSLILGVTIPWY